MLSDHLLKALKIALREAGISYKSVGGVLDISESSVKRLFAAKSFTLDRLEAVCDLAGIDLAELMQRAERLMQQTEHLTVVQEQEIVADPKLLLVGVCVINQCKFDEILEKYQFDELELVQIFAKLDRFGILEFLPGNKYRLTLSRNFQWNPRGPILRFFIESIARDFLSDKISQPSNHINYVWGMLTQASAKEFAKRSQRLIDDFVQLAGKDSALPMKQKLTSSLLVTFREDWEPNEFRRRHRDG